MSEFPFPPLSAFKSVAGRALELALNQALALDPDTRTALTVLNGRTLTLALESPALALQLQAEDGYLHVGPVDSTGPEPDLAIRSTLTGTLSQFNRIMGAATRDTTPKVGQVRVSGDAELARQLQRLAAQFDPDWQRPFVRVFGEILGVQIANTILSALRQVRRTGQALAESTADWLTEESRNIVPRAELDAFHHDVDALNDEVEQLATRIIRLATRTAA